MDNHLFFEREIDGEEPIYFHFGGIVIVIIIIYDINPDVFNLQTMVNNHH